MARRSDEVLRLLRLLADLHTEIGVVAEHVPVADYQDLGPLATRQQQAIGRARWLEHEITLVALAIAENGAVTS